MCVSELSLTQPLRHSLRVPEGSGSGAGGSTEISAGAHTLCSSTGGFCKLGNLNPRDHLNLEHLPQRSGEGPAEEVMVPDTARSH